MPSKSTSIIHKICTIYMTFSSYFHLLMHLMSFWWLEQKVKLIEFAGMYTIWSKYCLVLRWFMRAWDRYMVMSFICDLCLFQWCKTIWSIVVDCRVWWQWPAVVSGILKKLQDRNLLIFTPIILMPTLTQNVNLTNLYIVPTCHLVITYKRSSQVVLIKWKMCAFVLTITMIP